MPLGVSSRDGTPRLFPESTRGSQHTPVRKLQQGSSPFGQPGFAAIDFLATPDKCHNNRPVFVPIHHFEHHFRFGNLRPFCSSVLLRVPSTLSFVEEDDFLYRTFPVFAIILVGKSMNIRMNALTLSSASRRLTRVLSALRRVTSLIRASWMTSQRPIPERKDPICLISRLCTAFRPTSVFPAPGTPVTKQITFVLLARILDRKDNGFCGDIEILTGTTGMADLEDVHIGVEGDGSVDNRGTGLK